MCRYKWLYALLEAHPPKNLYVAVGEFERSMHAPIERLLTHLSAVPHTFYIAPEENHLSVLPTVLSRALRARNFCQLTHHHLRINNGTYNRTIMRTI